MIGRYPGALDERLPASPREGFRLASGTLMPCLGFGTWQMPDDERLRKVLLGALEAGYRHFDTASIYGNERGLGQALRESGVPRDELFVTDKAWNTDRGYNEVLTACERSLDALGLDYLDLYLLHWPAARGEPLSWQSLNSGSWRAMEELYRRGRARAIGVSNFMVHHLVPLLARAEIPPMVDQIESHPGWPQPRVTRFCQARGIRVCAWSPLGHGTLVHHPTMIEIAGAHGVSSAQVALRWCLQRGVVPITKSTDRGRQRASADIFSFTLSPEETRRLDEMPRAAFSGLDPDHVTF